MLEGNFKKRDMLYIAAILFIFIIFAVFTGHIYGDLFMDCGREAYLPQLMSDGKILFKDIFGIYNPLSYQINSLLYLIFGVSFNTLYSASYFNAFLIIAGLYLICRMFITEFYSFVFCLVMTSFFIFGCTNLISYIFPYAFAAPYSACCYTYSVLIFYCF